MPFGKRQCTCGHWVTTNALGRAAHARSNQCQIDRIWKDRIGEPGLGTLLFRARVSKDAEDKAVWLVRHMAGLLGRK
jgi:hypothetical protein